MSAPTPSHCASCGRPLRPRRTLIGDYPGTVVHVASGLCSRCHQHRDTRQLGIPTRQRMPKVCDSCHVPLHPRQHPEKGAPGSVAYGGRGLCDACRSRQRKGRPPITPDERTRMGTRKYVDARPTLNDTPVTVHGTTPTANALTAYLNRRRQRGIPTTGRRTP